MLFTQKQHQWYQYVLLMLFCFCLPIHQRLATGFILLLALNWLLSANFMEKFRQLTRPLPLLFIGFYCLHIFGLAYTDHLATALQNLERKLSLLIFPLILFSTAPVTNIQLKRLLLSFLLACLLGSLTCLASAGLYYAETGINTFYYESLSKHLGFHPSYYAMYMAFALFILCSYLVKDWSKLSLGLRSLGFLTGGYLLIFILLLSARMEILASLLLFPTAFLIFMIKQKKLLVGLALMTTGLLLIGTIAWTIPNTKMRIQVALNGLFNASKTQSKPDIRLQIWKSAVEAISEKPMLGQGTTGGFPKMMEQYRLKNITIATEKKLNTHNQYLETALSLGLVGLLLLLLLLLLPLVMAWRQNQFIYAFLLAFFALAILTENILERQQGIIFYACFNSLLARHLTRRNPDEIA
ncbi:MAG: O-antigen ligase family protein [Saprospiraceae bacterium]